MTNTAADNRAAADKGRIIMYCVSCHFIQRDADNTAAQKKAAADARVIVDRLHRELEVASI